jgi:uncharacterized protein YbjQ (UPF0145 family)
MKRKMLVTTGNSFEGYHVTQYLGVVRGLVVRATGFAKGLAGAFASFGSGNVSAYEEVCEAARGDAFVRLVEHAAERGADGIIAMRYDATEFSEGVTEVLAYGTAVKLSQEGESATVLPVNQGSPP